MELAPICVLLIQVQMARNPIPARGRATSGLPPSTSPGGLAVVLGYCVTNCTLSRTGTRAREETMMAASWFDPAASAPVTSAPMVAV